MGSFQAHEELQGVICCQWGDGSASQQNVVVLAEISAERDLVRHRVSAG